MHRAVWSLVFLLRGAGGAQTLGLKLGTALRTPRVLGTFVLSALLLAVNWCTYVWAVQNGHVLDASLGYFILPLVNGAGFCVFARAPAPGQWLAVAVAAAGVLWLYGAGRAPLPWVALVLAITFGFYGFAAQGGCAGRAGRPDAGSPGA